MKHSKRYETIKKNKGEYGIKEGVEFVLNGCSCKFDESIDVSFNLNLQKKHSIRDTVVFPHAFGKTVRVLVFARGSKAEDARAAGADYVGDDDLIQKIADGWVDFDVAIATPEMMKSIAKVARILGTKGLMPNPKAKTVTEDVLQAVKAVKAGRRECRADAAGIINFSIGKKSMSAEALMENFDALYTVITKKKPSDLKGDYIRSVHITSTMGKSVKIGKKNFK